MKQIALFMAVISMAFVANVQQAEASDHGHRAFKGHRGYYGNFGRGYRGTGFSITVGNGFNGFSYGRGIPVYGNRSFYGGGFARPYVAPVAPIRPYYGYGGYYGGYRGYGYRGCGRW